MNKSLLLIFLQFITLVNAFSCECFYSPPRKAIDAYSDIFVATIKSDTATIIKTWKGNMKVSSSFLYNHEKHDCALYSVANGGAHIFFMNSAYDKYCNVTEPYQIYNDLDYLDKTYKTSITISNVYSQLYDSLEYYRNFIIYAYDRIDIKDKKVIFIQSHRFLNWFRRFTIDDLHDIKRYSGFYSTRFYLIEKNYTSHNCQYDYVFWVATSHSRYMGSEYINKKIKKKVKKACR